MSSTEDWFDLELFSLFAQLGKIQEKNKFQRTLDIDQQRLYLEGIRRHGREWLASASAGVYNFVVDRHRKCYPDFDRHVKEAEQLYYDKVVEQTSQRKTTPEQDAYHNRLRARLTEQDK